MIYLCALIRRAILSFCFLSFVYVTLAFGFGLQDIKFADGFLSRAPWDKQSPVIFQWKQDFDYTQYFGEFALSLAFLSVVTLYFEWVLRKHLTLQK